jgi:hypothetical protein
VETVPGNKWALYGINGNILQFRINSKVDTRRFSLDTLN